MRNLFIKELRLCMHPTAPIFLLLSSMLLIPNYPYYVAFFYTGLAVFFTCLTGREQNDVTFTLSLPVRKRDAVRARFLFTVVLQALQLLLALPFILLRSALQLPENAVGMEANLALIAFALIQYAVFNLTFFSVYYRDVRRVGAAFVWSSVAMFVYMTVMEVAAHAIPFVRDVLDTPDPQNIGAKCAALGVGLVVYALSTLFSLRRAEAAFERQDL